MIFDEADRRDRAQRKIDAGFCDSLICLSAKEFVDLLAEREALKAEVAELKSKNLTEIGHIAAAAMVAALKVDAEASGISAPPL
jgi:chorismate mutase